MEFLGDLLGHSGGWSDCGSEALSVLPVVIEVFVLAPSAVTVMCDGASSDSDWEFVEPQPFSFSKRRPIACVESQENMSDEGTPVKAPPVARRMMPRTPQQSSQSSIEAMQWLNEMEDQESPWCGRERMVIARMEQHQNESECMKLEMAELELLMCPETQKLIEAHPEESEKKRRQRDGKGDHFVASKLR